MDEKYKFLFCSIKKAIYVGIIEWCKNLLFWIFGSILTVGRCHFKIFLKWLPFNSLYKEIETASE